MRYLLRFRKVGLILAFTLLLLCGVVPAAGAPTPRQYSVAVDQNGVRIASYSGRGVADLILPDAIDGEPVVAVGVGAFWGNTELVSVTLPDTVTRLDSNAFTGCTSLQTVCGGGLSAIGDAVFYGCDQLAELTVGGSLLTVGSDLFGTALPAISVPLSAGLAGWQTSYFALGRDAPELPMGRVGETQVTTQHLALYSLLDHYLAILPDDTAALWDQEPLTGSMDDATITCYGFTGFYSAAVNCGLYSLLPPDTRQQMDVRLDALLTELEQDAAELTAARRRGD